MSGNFRSGNRNGRGPGASSEPFTGPYPIPCPSDVGADARNYWTALATDPLAYYFGEPEWANLAVIARLMDAFFIDSSNVKSLTEARMRETRIRSQAIERMQLSPQAPVAASSPPPGQAQRRDPRIQAVPDAG